MGNTLFLVLEGPMQSWGEHARWSVRDTSFEPTKSGIVGLLACALGLREDEDLRALSTQIRLGVRCDQPGTLLTDYHIICDGVMSAEGKIKKNAKTKQAETVVSWRHYLCDASFLIAIQAKDDLIQSLADALQNPHWQIFLGRKSCPPSRPLFVGCGDYASIIDALKSYPLTKGGTEGQSVRLRVVLDAEPSTGDARRDEILSRSRRTYLPRYTQNQYLTLTVQTQEERCISPG